MIRSKPASPFSSRTIASPSTRQDFASSASTALAIVGKRLVKSLPSRVKRRTAATSRRAMMRKPLCLISWNQPGQARFNNAVRGAAMQYHAC